MPGRYHSADLAADAEIVLDGERLRLRVRGDASGWQPYLLNVLSDTAFGIDDEQSPGAGVALTVQRAPDGSVPSFQVDGLRARGLRFTRVASA